jgi:hypothetical protein
VIGGGKSILFSDPKGFSRTEQKVLASECHQRRNIFLLEAREVVRADLSHRHRLTIMCTQHKAVLTKGATRERRTLVTMGKCLGWSCYPLAPCC